jgi:predicted Rossmann fold flavoprotein
VVAASSLAGYPRGVETRAYDVVILGAGGAGLMCARVAARRGRRVAVVDHAARPGGKLIVSGGGKCNFTNRDVSVTNFVSENVHFARSALARFPPTEIIALLERHGVPYHERKHGQLFCDRSARDLIELLVRECVDAGVELHLSHEILGVERGEAFTVSTDRGTFVAPSVVVATGGLSLPKLGATGLGHDIARRFGHRIVPRAPALDGFVFSDEDRARLDGFAGNAIDAELTTNGVVFRENLLFTHLGFSGPVALQASLHWREGDVVWINFLPGFTREGLFDWFVARRTARAELKNQMAALMPRRLAERFCDLHLPGVSDLANTSNADLRAFCERLQRWRFVPARTVGYHKAEVTRGGVDTSELSSKTMESKKVPGMYFIGEVVDVTGWLGGFNYQWAWASGHAAGQVV